MACVGVLVEIAKSIEWQRPQFARSMRTHRGEKYVDLNLLERTNFDVTEVFTPTTPAKVTFVEREIVNEKLVNALNTPGKQIVVYGHSGNGKSTLLVNKLHQTYNGHITTRCMKGTTVNELMLNAFDKLDIYHPSERSNVRKMRVLSPLRQRMQA